MRVIFIVVVAMLLSPSLGLGRQSTSTKRVLVLYWYDKNYSSNAGFEESFRTVLPTGAFAYYPVLLSQSAAVPIYAMAGPSPGYGIVAGYLYSTESSAAGIVVIGVVAIVVAQTLLIVALLIERRRHQRSATSLAASEDRFAAAFRANPQPMLLTTFEECRYIEVNDSFLEMSGFRRDEVIHRSSMELNMWPSPAEHAAFVETLKQHGSLRGAETIFRKKDGALRVLLSSAEVVKNGANQCILIVCSDITDRKESERQLAELTGRLLRTQDEERRRIARELHDVTAQSIGLIMLNLAQVQTAASSLDKRSKDKLTESLALGEQALKDIRTLSYVLHPPLLDQAGLMTALKWYVKGFQERSGVKVAFTEVGQDGHRMPPEVEYALFRVVQECLTNIRRHTKSETAEINLTRTAQQVSLSVRDHGNGYQVEIPRNGEGAEFIGVGIPGMRHRLKQLGGELQVDSNEEGTTVTATVPVRWVIHDSDSISG